ncbi:Hsp20/alpha crystallin family protein [Winogradskyella pacifica]|uniref:Hsp20/alpha crystallin family protein n=1 Tax=Winogradskyella pacifica TaxID=664642 RepID=A0A3D9LLU1_9FLAO|nr:Hsp20/alpha crystallin family protein [Winogradskyella pacifica]
MFFFNNHFFEEDSLMPAMNVKDHEKDFEIEFVASGVSKKDFEVSINENILNICGKRKKLKKRKKTTLVKNLVITFKRSLQRP